MIDVRRDGKRYIKIKIEDKVKPILGCSLLLRRIRNPEKHESSVRGKIENDCSIITRNPNEKPRASISEGVP